MPSLCVHFPTCCACWGGDTLSGNTRQLGSPPITLNAHVSVLMFLCVSVDTHVSACMCMDEEAMWLSQKPANLQPGKADADGGQESADKAQMKGHRRM